VYEPPGNAVPDWAILAQFGQVLGAGGFDFTCGAEVWDEFRLLTAAGRANMTGITSAVCGAKPACNGPVRARTIRQQTPLPRPPFRHCGRPGSLSAATPWSRASRPIRISAGADDRTLVRPLAHADAHRQVRQARAPRTGTVREIHPDDAARLDVADGELVQLSSRRGTIQLPARCRTVSIRAWCSCRSTGVTCTRRERGQTT